MLCNKKFIFLKEDDSICLQVIFMKLIFILETGASCKNIKQKMVQLHIFTTSDKLPKSNIFDNIIKI